MVRIADDRGGRIGTYVEKFDSLRTSGETVIIDGLCASACTIVLGAVPHDRICVTPHANLGFHAAWDFGPYGRPVPNSGATQMLYSMYPSPVRRWIAARGGLKPQMIFLRGKQLTSMYHPCSRPELLRRGKTKDCHRGTIQRRAAPDAPAVCGAGLLDAMARPARCFL